MIAFERGAHVLRDDRTGKVLGRFGSRSAATRFERKHADERLRARRLDALNHVEKLIARKHIVAKAAKGAPPAFKPTPPPKSIVLEYTRRLVTLSRAMDKVIRQELTRHGVLPGDLLLTPAKPHDAGTVVRLDATPPAGPPGVAAALKAIERRLAELTGAKSLLAGVDEISAMVGQYGKTAWRSQVKQSLGISPADIGVDAAMAHGFRQTNLGLIVSLSHDKVQRVGDVFAEHAGAHNEEIALALQEQLGVTESRAALIARDQVLKFNAQVSQAQHAAAGIDRYVWSTSKDERVRESHVELEGQTFSYADPPIVDEKTGRRANPGEDFQCRCVALPVIDDVTESLWGPGATVPEEDPTALPPTVSPEAQHDAEVAAHAAAIAAAAAKQQAMLATANANRIAEQAAAKAAHLAEVQRLTQQARTLRAQIAGVNAQAENIANISAGQAAHDEAMSQIAIAQEKLAAEKAAAAQAALFVPPTIAEQREWFTEIFKAEFAKSPGGSYNAPAETSYTLLANKFAAKFAAVGKSAAAAPFLPFGEAMDLAYTLSLQLNAASGALPGLAEAEADFKQRFESEVADGIAPSVAMNDAAMDSISWWKQTYLDAGKNPPPYPLNPTAIEQLANTLSEGAAPLPLTAEQQLAWMRPRAAELVAAGATFMTEIFKQVRAAFIATYPTVPYVVAGLELAGMIDSMLAASTKPAIAPTVSLPGASEYQFAGAATGIGGAGEKSFYTAGGKKYLFKLAKAKAGGEAKPFAAVAQELTAKLGTAVKPFSVPVQEITLGGKHGTVQPWMGDNLGSLKGIAPSALSKQEALDVANEHLIDWVTSNHDTHGANLIRLPDGRIVGIDKEQAFRFFGKDKLTTEYHPNQEENPPYYNKFWQEFAQGKMPNFDPREMLAGVQKLEAFDNNAYRAMLQAYYDKLPAGVRAAKPNFVEEAMARKAGVRAQFEKFIGEQYAKKTGQSGTFTFTGGWSPGAKAAPALTPTGEFKFPQGKLSAAAKKKAFAEAYAHEHAKQVAAKPHWTKTNKAKAFEIAKEKYTAHFGEAPAAKLPPKIKPAPLAIPSGPRKAIGEPLHPDVHSAVVASIRTNVPGGFQRALEHVGLTDKAAQRNVTEHVNDWVRSAQRDGSKRIQGAAASLQAQPGTPEHAKLLQSVHGRYKGGAGPAPEAGAHDAAFVEQMRATAQATQALYANKPVVRLYRGVGGYLAGKIREAVRAGATEIEIPTSTASSWSTSITQASGFGDVVITYDAPRESFLMSGETWNSVSRTAASFTDEREIVLMLPGSIRVPVKNISGV